MMLRFITITIISIILTNCQETTIPKPKAMLRLDYPKASYQAITSDCPFTFEQNTLSVLKEQTSCNMSIEYPNMKATIYLTYRPVQHNIQHLLRDAQKLTYEHVIKANNILEQPYINQEDNVYGMFYEVDGNAASQSQFYVTDSTRHFLTGSIYFRVRPNFDSIQPAANYLKNDARKIMESITWK